MSRNLGLLVRHILHLFFKHTAPYLSFSPFSTTACVKQPVIYRLKLSLWILVDVAATATASTAAETTFFFCYFVGRIFFPFSCVRCARKIGHSLLWLQKRCCCCCCFLLQLTPHSESIVVAHVVKVEKFPYFTSRLAISQSCVCVCLYGTMTDAS